jgi:hypothetical protein
MFPLVGVPPTIAQVFSQYRDLFCRQVVKLPSTYDGKIKIF